MIDYYFSPLFAIIAAIRHAITLIAISLFSFRLISPLLTIIILLLFSLDYYAITPLLRCHDTYCRHYFHIFRHYAITMTFCLHFIIILFHFH